MRGVGRQLAFCAIGVIVTLLLFTLVWYVGLRTGAIPFGSLQHGSPILAERSFAVILSMLQYVLLSSVLLSAFLISFVSRRAVRAPVTIGAALPVTVTLVASVSLYSVVMFVAALALALLGCLAGESLISRLMMNKQSLRESAIVQDIKGRLRREV